MKKLIALVPVLALGSFAAADITFDLAGLESYDAWGDADNSIVSLDIGSDQVTSVTWSDAAASTNGGSWGNEMRFGLTSTSGAGVYGMAFFPDAGGSGSFVESGAFDASTWDIFADADGILNVQFYESYEDVAGADGYYTGGTMTIHTTAVPAPGALALLGVAGFAARRRRK